MKPDKLIWEILHTYDDGFVEVVVYAHKKNFNNNGDKFLIHLFAGSQPFKIPEENINDIDYDLKEIKESESVWFIAVGNCELDGILHSFSIFNNKKNEL